MRGRGRQGCAAGCLVNTHALTPSLRNPTRTPGLLCEGEGAKAVLLAAGGLGALLGVAGQPLVPPSVLAAATTALLNLSSYVPAQVLDIVPIVL